MSLKKVAPQLHQGILMSLGIAVLFACTGLAHAEEAGEAPKESMFQAGKSYFSRASDRLVDSVSEKSESLINQAMVVIGVRYRWNTELPQSGLDGSSFVAYVFKDKLGFLLPNKSTQMSRVGKPINRDDLQPGDLVFFNTMRLTFSHVGIYVGDNKFIHSPSKGASVRVDDLSSVYWDRRFDGARRLDGSDSLDDSERRELLNQVNNIKRKPQSL
ncbi:C40 family peptidase [Polynucleobacter paneuropaeus]|uniref:C40 family peptidase n=2 Tax=Polynucleobacter paneuropaeus TaxID=2527775 RepID=A0A2Z4JRT6_9BURK|nr:C40 family peptidase [Polynucleobacter paneuropaeus]AWW49413.1 peptidoglycan endopeptidase [Polynucleobacter paneuropaeus]MBT8553240.1 C40 family peptidase [Polynucleobacter paneuropaeus]MBT8588571.1 C40 family peptidase [Polynucleobacter paneuropaeus]MBT8592059.1 C40 family peptidase [Polynucleobacter paneuropaeus]MBT8593062.1 C40 family peptidase [Polynucleobacter paneuropaeus]